MRQCQETTFIRDSGRVYSRGGGQCLRNATYLDTKTGGYFCKQHAKVRATVYTKAKNQIRPECVALNSWTGEPFPSEGAPLTESALRSLTEGATK